MEGKGPWFIFLNLSMKCRFWNSIMNSFKIFLRIEGKLKKKCRYHGSEKDRDVWKIVDNTSHNISTYIQKTCKHKDLTTNKKINLKL